MNFFEEQFLASIELKKLMVEQGGLQPLLTMADILANALEDGRKLLLCGNGGSASDAQHLAAEFLVRLRPKFNRSGLPALTLAQDTSTITACANDYGYDYLYQRVLQSIGQAGDVLLAITTSGNSVNVIKALEMAREMNIKTFGFLGSSGGDALSLCDHAMLVPSHETGRVQEVHILAGHSLLQSVEDKLVSREYIRLNDTGLK